MERRGRRCVAAQPAGEVTSIADGCRPGTGEDGAGGGRGAGHGRGDALALQGVDEAGGVADEERGPRARDGADDPHLQPSAEAPAFDGGGQQAESAEVGTEGIEALDRPRGRGSVGAQAQPEADVGDARLAGKQPAVAGEPPPRRRRPTRR